MPSAGSMSCRGVAASESNADAVAMQTCLAEKERARSSRASAVDPTCATSREVTVVTGDAMESSGIAALASSWWMWASASGGEESQAHTANGCIDSNTADPQADAETIVPHACDDCPICYEAISADDAAMRCAGGGAGNGAGRHYFHKECLGNWIRICHRNLSTPTCPVCRSAVHVNIQQLAAYLDDEQTTAMPEEERGLLEQLLARARATIGTSCEEETVWAEPFAWEEASQVGLFGLAATIGFAAAYSESSVDDLILLALPPQDQSLRVAEGVGYVAGMTTRAVQTVVEMTL